MQVHWHIGCQEVQAQGREGGRCKSFLVIQDSADTSEAKVFRAHAPPQGACENLVCALKLLAKQQMGGESLMQVLVAGLQEQSRFNRMDELRRFIKVDNHEGVKIGDSEKHSVALHVVEPKVSKDFPEPGTNGRPCRLFHCGRKQ